MAGCSALAYLSHPVGGLYVPLLLTFAAHRAGAGQGTRGAVRPAVRFGLWLALWLLPWGAFKLWVHHPEVFFRYPLGDGQGFTAAGSVASWLRCRLDNLWFTLVPGALYFSPLVRAWIDGPLSEPLRWAIGYAKTLPGALGVGLYLVSLFALFRRRPPSAATEASSGYRRHLIFGAFAVMLVFWGFSNDGLGRNCLEPLAILLIVYTAATVNPAWAGWRWLLLLTAIEALSVRAIGILAAPSFSSAQLNAETITLGAVTAVATVAPAFWFFLRSPSALPRA